MFRCTTDHTLTTIHLSAPREAQIYQNSGSDLSDRLIDGSQEEKTHGANFANFATANAVASAQPYKMSAPRGPTGAAAASVPYLQFSTP